MKKLKSNFLNITLIRPFNNLNQLYLKPFNLSRVTCPPQPLLPLLFQPQRLSHMPFSFLIYLLFQTPSYLLHHALTLLVSTHLSQTLPTFLAPQFPGMWTSRKERWSTSIVPPQQVFFFFFSSHCTACKILVPWPGIKPGSLEVEAWILTTGMPGNSQQVIFKHWSQSALNEIRKDFPEPWENRKFLHNSN